MKGPTKAAVVFGSIMLLASCGSSELPAVSTPTPTLDDDDRAVMKAVLDEWLRPSRDQSTQRGQGNETAPSPTRAVFLVFDTTVAICELPISFEPFLPGCIDIEWLDHLNAPDGTSRRSALAIFGSRNRRPLRIEGLLGDDVVYIPGNVDRPGELEQFARKYPRPAVVMFSAPVYPSAGTAVIAYRQVWSDGGFVQVRRASGGWSVVRHTGWVE